MRCRYFLLVWIAYLSTPLLAHEEWPPPSLELLEQAKTILAEAPLIDGHNDLPSRFCSSWWMGT
jgi:hypothetical protein